MLKSALVDSAVRILLESGYKVVDCRGSRSSFDILAKRDETLYLIKTLANVEGLSRESVVQLKAVSAILGGIPYVLSQRMKNSELTDGTVYDRYGVSVSNIPTFSKLVNDTPPNVYSTRGNYCVHISQKKLTHARRRMGLTQDTLAETLGVTKQSVYRYEHNGRVSLDVFERLEKLFGNELADRDYAPQHGSCEESQDGMTAATSLKRTVRREFDDMGFHTSITNAPFDLVASLHERVFSVVSNDWRRLHDKLTVLEEISAIVDGYTVCISERKVESDVNVLTPEELAQVKTAKELFKLLSD
ncbi:MAG: helix-turn-helix domain-containing protein [Candidatus Altiarchaeota archaeon]